MEYCNDVELGKQDSGKEKVYEKLVARMKKSGWKVEYIQVALGTHESVYRHLVDTLRWFIGAQDFNTRKMLVKDVTLHGAREASRALRTARTSASRGQEVSREKRTMDNTTQSPRACARVITRGPGRKLGASSYTQKRLSISYQAMVPASKRICPRVVS